jgi:hypothetical protein
MKRRTILLHVIVFILLLVLIPISGQAYGRSLPAPISTAFTYQGKLVDGGAPANGMYDLTFALYDALSGGVQIGATVTRHGVTVADGLFTVQLDFGAVFDGTALYLEIGVRPGGGGAYVTLAPRQALTAAPYARYAAQAPWSGLTGVPAGFADGTDDGSSYTAGTGLFLNTAEFSILDSYRLPQTCANGQLPQWNGSTWICADQSAYTAGTGLALSGGQFGLLVPYRLPQGCANGQISQWNGGAWVCANDSGATYTAGAGIDITGNVVSATYAGSSGDYGTAGTLARSDHAHSNYLSIGSPAGGDLTGTYPNPVIAANAVGSAEIADDSVDMADTRNWVGMDQVWADFLAGDNNPVIQIWGEPFSPSSTGTCLVIVNAVILSDGYADDDPPPLLGTLMMKVWSGIVYRDSYANNPFTPQDVTSDGSISASVAYVWTVSGSTRFGCEVSDPDGNWDTDETVYCQISYICQ